MEIFFSIVSIIGIIIVGFTLFLCIRKDYKMKKLYNSAEKCKALVLKEIGTESLSEYGAGVIGGGPTIKVKVYLVEFEIEGKKYTKEVRTKRKDIKTNELIEIRYVIRENKPIIISEIYKVRLDHLIIGVIGGVILSAICIILKINNIW